MTNNTKTEIAKPRHATPAEQFHVLVSGFMIHTKANSFTGASAVLDRGATVTITQEMIDAARDRFGSLDGSWVALLHDADAQRAKWGEVKIAPGPWPADSEVWVYGDRRWETDRDAARRAAWAITDDAARAAALAAVESRFGPSRTTSKTTATYQHGEHPTEIQARQQEQRFAAARAAGMR